MQFEFGHKVPPSMEVELHRDDVDGFLRLRFNSRAVLSVSPEGVVYIYPDQMRKVIFINRIQSRNGLTNEATQL
jgi:hypothetical protein